MNRPIFIITIGYIIGIIWGIYFKISISLFYIFIIPVIIVFIYKYNKFNNIFIIIIIASIISNTIVSIKENEYDSKLANIENIKCNCKVVSNKISGDNIDKYVVKVIDGKLKNSRFYITTDKKIHLQYGNEILLEGEVKKPTEEKNYKGFNYKQYLKTLNIIATIKASNIEIIKTKTFFINDVFLKIRDNIYKTYNIDTQGLISGILIGDKENITDKLKEQFSESNISHVLAISGMHITYIIFLVENSTRGIFGKNKSKIIATIFLFVYMFITGLSVSVMRASIMGMLACMAFVLRRKSDTINNIAISALIILILNPYNIISLSFLLSYGGTIGIILFQKNICKSINKFIKITKISEILSVSISAQIIIAPIMIYKFNTIGIAFLITNLLLSFIIGFIVIGGFIQIVVTFFSIKLGTIIAKAIQILLYALIFISKLGGEIPFGNVLICTPPFLLIILYYIAVLVFKKRYIKRYICLITIIIIISQIITIIPQNLRIYFVDVGQGDCTLIKTPNGRNILIDGGGNANYDIGKNILLPYLLNRGVSKLDYIFISHFDLDHCNSALYIMKKLEVKDVIIGKQYEEYENYAELKKIVNQNKINLRIVEAGNKINIENEIYFDILWPDSQNIITENSINNNSMVCKLNYKDFSILFTGDIEEKAEKAIVNKYNKNLKILKSSVLKAAHHGSKTSSSLQILKNIKPEAVLIGVGENNKFGHPSDITIENLKNMNVNIYRTDVMGEITIKTNGKMYKIDKHVKY